MADMTQHAGPPAGADTGTDAGFTTIPIRARDQIGELAFYLEQVRQNLLTVNDLSGSSRTVPSVLRDLKDIVRMTEAATVRVLEEAEALLDEGQACSCADRPGAARFGRPRGTGGRAAGRGAGPGRARQWPPDGDHVGARVPGPHRAEDPARLRGAGGGEHPPRQDPPSGLVRRGGAPTRLSARGRAGTGRRDSPGRIWPTRSCGASRRSGRPSPQAPGSHARHHRLRRRHHQRLSGLRHRGRPAARPAPARRVPDHRRLGGGQPPDRQHAEPPAPAHAPGPRGHAREPVHPRAVPRSAAASV